MPVLCRSVPEPLTDRKKRCNLIFLKYKKTVFSDHGTKSDLKGTFELCLTKNNFPPKINQDRVAYNVFGPQNDFHELNDS